MSLSKALPTALKELRLHLCQTSPASAGVRAFLNESYLPLKAANPDLKVLIREAEGVSPRVLARFEMGRETQAPLADLSASQVTQRVEELIAAGVH
ncbi:putative nadh-ubiquinone oxidoreductase 10.5 kda subunit [Mrakia frigida]|uniref:L51/S25/CI-B8 domain-containing protein n=1 Tax=Mrakia frigida TaxID=29902 RepID=UPI003FCC06D9